MWTTDNLLRIVLSLRPHLLGLCRPVHTNFGIHHKLIRQNLKLLIVYKIPIFENLQRNNMVEDSYGRPSVGHQSPSTVPTHR